MRAKRVLIIEDDEDIRFTMKALLEMQGYSVECAVNGEDGIQALRRSATLPGVVLLDMNMPVKDGFQFREEQEQDAKLADVPVVLMSAANNIEETTARVRARAFIKKPFDFDHVLKVVGEYFTV